MRKWLLTAAIGISGLCLATPAAADTRPPGPGGGAYVDGGGSPTAEAEDGGTEPGGGGDDGSGGGGTPAPCHWEVAIEDDAQFPIYDADTLDTMHSNTGRWLQYVCEGMGPVAVDGQFAIPEGGLVDPAALAARALESIELGGPPISTSPTAPDLYVQVATWLGIGGGWWHSYEATATAGNVSVTVQASPTSATFDMGDGSTIRCEGATARWDEAGGEECTHTYRSSHADLTITATVELDVSWVSNIGPGGDLDPITRTSSIDVTVGEIQGTGQD